MEFIIVAEKIMKLVILISNIIFVLAFEGFTKQNILIIEKLIRHYSIKNIFIASENIYDSERYLTDFRNFDNPLTFSIHTKDDQFIEYTHSPSELLLISANNSTYLERIFLWLHVLYHSQATMIVIVFSESQDSFQIPLEMFPYSQVLTIISGKTNKISLVRRFFKAVHTAEEFIKTNIYENPVAYWPKIKLKYKKFTMEDFPLVMSLNSTSLKSGILVYYVSTFLKYYEHYRDHNIKNNEQKSKYIDNIDVSPEVLDLSEGYPLKMTKICFMLPIMDEFSHQDFLKKPFKQWVWILTVISLLYFTIVLRLVAIPDVFLSFYESLACSLGSVQNGIRIKYIYIQLFVYGFIIWNLYSAKLSSFLSTSNLGKELKTYDDVNEANISLWANYLRDIQINLSDYMKSDHPNIFKYEEIFNGKFDYRIPMQEFYGQLYTFNASHGYLINEIQWNFISRSQMLLTRKLFSYSNICPEYGFIYPIDLYEKTKILKDIFTSFTLKVIESGLVIAWERFSYSDIKFKYQTDFGVTSLQILGFSYFEVPCWILTFGIVMSSLVFVVEKCIAKFNHRKRFKQEQAY